MMAWHAMRGVLTRLPPKHKNRNALLDTRLDNSNFLSVFSKQKMMSIDEFQINKINVDLPTSGFDNEVLSVDACPV